MDRRSFCLGVLAGGVTWSGLTRHASAETAAAGPAAAKVVWQKNLKSAHKLAIETDRPILCGYCHKLERETLADKRLVPFIEREFVPVHLDYDRDSKVAKILDVDKLPCTVVLSPEADLLQKSVGFADAKQYAKMLRAALEKRAEIRPVGNTSRQ
jgi:Protein of unknown function, DUF255